MKIAVLGPGGVGGLLAALLERNGEQVVVVARESTAEVISEHGLRVSSVSFGEFVAHPRALTRLEEPVDALIVATKATGPEASKPTARRPAWWCIPARCCWWKWRATILRLPSGWARWRTRSPMRA